MVDAKLDQLLRLRREVIAPVADALHLSLSEDTDLGAPPTVLLLGNHSSGKSSLINHLLGERIQRTGVAPTDDSFTLLFFSEQPANLDGAALTTRPDLPMAPLARFGQGLVRHLQGRGMPHDLLRQVRLVDSPGMIDDAAAESKRPYDFPAVVRALADHCDLVLLFFDPEKPGTTGETLKTLTGSLTGLDHKLRIVMNKMDLFEGLRDFARTYGALCWNLSRALPTKDLPHIYTTIIPELARERAELPLDTFADAMHELEDDLAELPSRRFDAVVSRGIDEGRQMLVRARVVNEMRHRALQARLLSIAIGLVVAVVLAAVGSWHIGANLMVRGVLYLVSAALVVVASAVIGSLAARLSEKRNRRDLDTVFRAAFHEERARTAESLHLEHVWATARPALERVLDAFGLAGLGRTSKRRLKRLEQAASQELPALRTAG